MVADMEEKERTIDRLRAEAEKFKVGCNLQCSALMSGGGRGWSYWQLFVPSGTNPAGKEVQRRPAKADR